MAKKSGSKLKRALYVFLSFILSFLILILSMSLLMELTIFNKDFVIREMNNVSYFETQTSEISRNLTDLGYASGLDESFFDNLIDESLLRDDTSEYLDKFYSGEGSVVKTDNFKTEFNNAIDVYIENKGINPQSVDESSRKYLVDNAAKIYKESLQLPFLNYIAGYFLGIKNAMPIVIGVSSILILFICVILIFSTKWKHRSIRYICYSTITAFLSTLAPFIFILTTGKMRQLNISSRATYDFFVGVSDTIMMYLLYMAVFFAVLSVALFVLFRYMYPKRSSLSGHNMVNASSILKT